MIKIENQCVGCQFPCIYDACPYYKVEVHYCDRCNSQAEYCLDGEDLCTEHTLSKVDDIWLEMSIEEKMEMLQLDFKKL